MLGRTNTGGVGGGGGLNFQVIGGTTAPRNPKENTIWIDTDVEITSWIFSATEPETATEGMVWISTGASSPVGFNTLKKNNITVYPLSAKQYVSGAWVDVEAKSYQNGAWVEWMPEGALYFHGDQVESVTGGWKTTYFSGWGDYSSAWCDSSSGGLSINATTGNGNSSGLFVTNERISRGSYTKLCFLLSDYTKTSGTFTIYVGASTKNTVPNIESLSVRSSPTSNGVCKVDISSMSTFYVACGVSTQSSGRGTVTFEEVWLE